MARKVGILTFHCAHNYGAVLQAYATQALLSEAGYDVEIIDYRPDYLVKPYRRFALSRLKGKDFPSTVRHIASEILLVPVRCRRFNAFERFISRRLKLSERVDAESFAGDYDTILIGSDQVWNKNITGGCFDPMYFADFPLEQQGIRCIADAVSMESESISDEDAAYLKARAEAFDAISVRESQLAVMLEQKCGVRAAHIQDPVIQVVPKVWEELASECGRKRPYILVYRIRNHASIDRFVKDMAAMTGADIVEVTAFPDGRKLFNGNQCEGVEDFLGLLKNAAYVVTTSFHAVAFSIIFKRPFNCFAFGKGSDTRQQSLLSSVGLEDRMLPLGAAVPEELECDFLQASVRLEALRKESSDFVLNTLSE